MPFTLFFSAHTFSKMKNSHNDLISGVLTYELLYSLFTKVSVKFCRIDYIFPDLFSTSVPVRLLRSELRKPTH